MFEPGAQLGEGRYRVVRVLGQGAQATTYEAVDAKRGRLVAVKRFVVRGASSWKEVELAEREAQVLRSLDHPLVPRYVDNFEEGGALYLVTELVEGESLASLLKAGRRFGPDEIVRLVSDLAEATRYLHGRAPPVIHRDIKPANVLLRRDGRFCLVDFGAVRATLAKREGSTVVGTFGFMAPEQFQGRALPQSDVYAIGATALSVLTGREPEELPHRGLGIDVGAALGGAAPVALVTALGLMLEPDPDRRPATLEGALTLLRGGGAPRAPQGAPPRGPPRGPASSHRLSALTPRAPSRARRARELGPPARLAAIALDVARYAVLFSVVYFVPLLLAMLSLVFGKPLRRAAGSTRDAGHRALRHLERVRSDALGYEGPVAALTPDRAVADADLAARAPTRVAAPPDPASERLAEAEAAAVEEQAQGERARRGR